MTSGTFIMMIVLSSANFLVGLVPERQSHQSVSWTPPISLSPPRIRSSAKSHPIPGPSIDSIPNIMLSPPPYTCYDRYILLGLGI